MKNSQRYQSVWDAIAETPEEAADLRARAQLIREIGTIIRAKKWTQAEAVHRCGVAQTRIGDLLQGKISRFSLDDLADIATVIRHERP